MIGVVLGLILLGGMAAFAWLLDRWFALREAKRIACFQRWSALGVPERYGWPARRKGPR